MSFVFFRVSFERAFVFLTSLSTDIDLSKVTDKGLGALGYAGCGASLVSLTLEGACLFFFFCMLFSFFCSRPPIECAGLGEGMTDEGLRTLAAAGCGPSLTLLHLESESDVL